MECMENDRSILNMEKLVVENDWKNNNWRNMVRRVVLTADIQKVLIFKHNVWSSAYDVIWSASTKLSSPRAFQPIVMAAVVVIIAPFIAAIVIATRHDSLDGSGGSFSGSLDGLGGSLSGSLSSPTLIKFADSLIPKISCRCRSG